MRLVSQAGVADIPYEKAVIFHNMDGVRAVVDGREYLLGEYSNILKSQKVMEMVRENNFWDKDVFQFPKDSEVEI